MMAAKNSVELEWLRYFRKQVVHSLGPADDDIIQAIRDEWVEDGNKLPRSERGEK
jgi:hypothetical protein